MLCKGCEGLAARAQPQCFQSVGVWLCPADKGAGGGNPAGKAVLNVFCKEALVPWRVVWGGFHLCPLCQESQGWFFVFTQIFYCRRLVGPEKPEAGLRLALGSLDRFNMEMFWVFCRKEARWGAGGVCREEERQGHGGEGDAAQQARHH